MLPPSAYLSLTPNLTICRLLNGLWQVSGAHGSIHPQRALVEMWNYHQDGFTTWDLADHYGPAEDFIGALRHQLKAHGDEVLSKMQAFTKWVPRPGLMTRAVVEQAIDLSRRRMQTECLDLLQFHWWEYRDKRYLDALHHLTDLQLAGKIRYLGLTNFDTERLAELTAQGIRLLTNQVQYSLIDRRPEVRMVEFCRQHQITLLTYGTLCGGLLSEKYLEQPEPSAYMLTTASLRKYKQMIDAWGGWGLFQALLRVLKNIAEKHQTGIAAIAIRYILDKTAVAGVIIGSRLGIAEHRTENTRVFDLRLDHEDLEKIHEVTAQSRDLFAMIGDCGDEYRR